MDSVQSRLLADLVQNGALAQAIRHSDAARLAAENANWGTSALLDARRTISPEVLRSFESNSAAVLAESERLRYRAIFQPSIIDEVHRIAESAQSFYLESALAPYRTTVESFSDKLLHLPSLEVVSTSSNLNAFVNASTISDIFTESALVDFHLFEATRQFALASLPTFDSLSRYGQFLDAAGFNLPHWPNFRLLSVAEKRRRFREQLNNNAEPVHVKKARSLVHRYEITLREILDDVMASSYGEDWMETRLPLCECNDLLGKWRKRGGHVFAHADYAHYERIMRHPEHFEMIFEAGFDDVNALAALIKKAGSLRAALQHFHPFSQEDLRDLRLTWRTIETGLLALTADYDIEHWH